MVNEMKVKNDGIDRQRTMTPKLAERGSTIPVLLRSTECKLVCMKPALQGGWIQDRVEYWASHIKVCH